MEFGFRIAELFPAEISIVGCDMIPKDCPALNILGPQIVKDRLKEIMDTMGRASAAAQSLHQIITSAEKLRNSDGEQKVYFLCDFSRNQMVGLLKMGRKKLFVFDQSGVQHEMNPLCVLDFYVHESRQRMGCGKLMFEAMMRIESAQVQHLAIDRPSDKFLYFLKKYYGLSQMIPQVNNFVIFDGFFLNRSDYAGKKARWGGLDQAVPSPERLNRHNQNKTRFQDSSSYNTEPALHLRNQQGGPPGYISQRNVSSIANVVQPPGNMNGHHTQSNFMTRHEQSIDVKTMLRRATNGITNHHKNHYEHEDLTQQARNHFGSNLNHHRLW